MSRGWRSSKPPAPVTIRRRDGSEEVRPGKAFQPELRREIAKVALKGPGHTKRRKRSNAAALAVSVARDRARFGTEEQAAFAAEHPLTAAVSEPERAKREKKRQRQRRKFELPPRVAEALEAEESEP